MYFSVIIAYYKNHQALRLILKALQAQSVQNFEVIIAEDDICSDFADQEFDKFTFKTKHVFQDIDQGFTKNATLNKAIKVSEGEYIIFVDGDCVPHQHFIKAYSKWMSPHKICFGRRVMIGPKLTEKLYRTQDLTLLNFVSILFSDTTRLKYGLYLPFSVQKRNSGIWGHNWCVAKSHLLAINGFDEDYITAGVGEDVDIEWRLTSLGLTLYSIRFSALQYHLHHRENYDQTAIQIGKNLLRIKIQQNAIVCKNGLVKL